MKELTLEEKKEIIKKETNWQLSEWIEAVKEGLKKIKEEKIDEGLLDARLIIEGEKKENKTEKFKCGECGEPTPEDPANTFFMLIERSDLPKLTFNNEDIYWPEEEVEEPIDKYELFRDLLKEETKIEENEFDITLDDGIIIKLSKEDLTTPTPTTK